MFYNLETYTCVIKDSLASNYTDYSFAFAKVHFETGGSVWSTLSDWTCSFKWNTKDTFFLDTNPSFQGCFYGAGNEGRGITIPPRKSIKSAPQNGYNCLAMFADSKFKFIKVATDADDETQNQFSVGRGAFMFSGCASLEEISGFNFRSSSRGNYDTNCMFSKCSKLHSITNCVMPMIAFSLADSPNFTAEEMTEVFNQLETISTTQTITINATVFDKLSTEQIAVATGKGWNVARA